MLRKVFECWIGAWLRFWKKNGGETGRGRVINVNFYTTKINEKIIKSTSQGVKFSIIYTSFPITDYL